MHRADIIWEGRRRCICKKNTRSIVFSIREETCAHQVENYVVLKGSSRSFEETNLYTTIWALRRNTWPCMENRLNLFHSFLFCALSCICATCVFLILFVLLMLLSVCFVHHWCIIFFLIHLIEYLWPDILFFRRAILYSPWFCLQNLYLFLR